MFNGRSIEPSLDELFGDAPMRLLMGRDGVTESDIRALLSKLKDARTVALAEAKCARGASKSGADTPDRTETVLSSRAGKSSEAGKNPLRSYELGIYSASPNQSHVFRDFWNLAYQEIDKRESGRLRKRDENARQEIVAVRTFLSILEQQRSTPWS